jgi:hypothetical protein
MTEVRGSYQGLDTMSVTTKSDWSHADTVRERHEALCLHGRKDIVHLLDSKVQCSQLPRSIADSKMRLSEILYPPGSTDKYTKGATFVPVDDAYSIQISINHEEKFGRMHDCINANGRTVTCRKNWPSHINYVQREDDYGMPFPKIPNLINSGPEKLPAMMPWALLAMISSSKELYQAIDKKLGPWDVNRPEGHLMSFIRKHCHNHTTMRDDSRSPFSSNITIQTLLKKVLACENSNASDMECDGPSYHYSAQYMSDIFPPQQYPTIDVLNDLETLDTDDSAFYDSKDIIIVPFDHILDRELLQKYGEGIKFRQGDVSFQCRSIVLFKAENSIYTTHKRKQV